jgi:hypothetical protein
MSLILEKVNWYEDFKGGFINETISAFKTYNKDWVEYYFYFMLKMWLKIINLEELCKL